MFRYCTTGRNADSTKPTTFHRGSPHFIFVKKPDKQTPGSELEFTGERFVTSVPKNSQIAYEHLHRYFLATELVSGLEVLDIACGEGYGSNLLARRAKNVKGVDLDEQAILHANAKYKRRNVSFEVGDCVKIPADDDAFDAVVSFETVEHVTDPNAFIAEVQRVLSPGGLLIISSPNRAVYTDRIGNENPFHVSELYHEQFLELLASGFKNVSVAHQRLIAGSFIALSTHEKTAQYGSFAGDFRTSKFHEGVSDGVYTVAVCSNAPLPPLKLGVYETPSESAKIWDTWERFPALRERCANLETEVAAHRDLLNEKQRELELHGLKLAETEASLNTLRQTSVDWTRTMEAAQAEFVRTSERLKETEISLAAIQKTANEEREERATLTERLQQISGQLKLANEEVNRSRNNEETLIDRLQQSDSQLTLAQQTRDGAIEKADFLAKRLEQAEQRARKFEAELLSQQESVASWKDRALAAAREIDGNSRKIETLEAELQKLRMRNEKLEEARLADFAAYGRAEDLLKASQDELESVLSQVEQFRADSVVRETDFCRQLAIQNDKIARMQRTASWKLTMPLRALRRLLIDPFRSP